MTNTDQTPPAPKHTPAPWRVSRRPIVNTCNVEIKHGDDLVAVAACRTWGYGAVADKAESQANARRIIAAVNACEGIATSALEQGVVRDLHEALHLCWHQLSLWVQDIPPCEFSTEDDEALTKACAVLTKAPWSERP
jgi:hypothetical protein